MVDISDREEEYLEGRDCFCLSVRGTSYEINLRVLNWEDVPKYLRDINEKEVKRDELEVFVEQKGPTPSSNK